MKSAFATTTLALSLAASGGALAATTMTPGQYEYTIRMNMPGGPANMPAQTTQQCLTAKDVAGDTPFRMPSASTDCKVRDMNQTGSQFSYKISCTKPQKLDGTVKGTFTPTSMAMDMTMSLPEMPQPMTQSITAKRIGDCK